MGIFNKKITDDKKEPDNKVAAGKVVSSKNDSQDKSNAVSMKELYDGGGTVAKSNIKHSQANKETAHFFSESYRVLVKPLITEKAAAMSADGRYFFEVDINANKIMVAKAVHDIYGVKPASVNIVRLSGKTKRTGKVTGRRKDHKKAIVTLPKGKTISVYEGV